MIVLWDNSPWSSRWGVARSVFLRRKKQNSRVSRLCGRTTPFKLYDVLVMLCPMSGFVKLIPIQHIQPSRIPRTPWRRNTMPWSWPARNRDSPNFWLRELGKWMALHRWPKSISNSWWTAAWAQGLGFLWKGPSLNKNRNYNSQASGCWWCWN